MFRFPVTTQEPVKVDQDRRFYQERCIRLKFTGHTLDWTHQELAPIRLKSVFWLLDTDANAGARALHFDITKGSLQDKVNNPLSCYYGQNTQIGPNSLAYMSWVVGATDMGPWYNTAAVVYETHGLGEHVQQVGDAIGFILINGSVGDTSLINLVYEVLV